ncbi:acyltransferase [Nocardioides mangrovicus]|uniref:Acyltransferase n=1 Tax=Nocardioides mangrovicus TaxID=2478913 RepID=A0A3L8P0Y6_9ACTN|nr:acyltransferase [Nocardioides mangrovicus]RLV49110.1 acyltransferase [Nocardioides mangrovicus]
MRDHNAALDGVRALAIVTVVAGHYGTPHIDEFHGVTVFFVLSGYLITTLLMREHDLTGRLDLRAFYRRRLARLTPAMVLAVVVTAAVLLLVGVPVSTWGLGAVSTLGYGTEAVLGLAGGEHVSGWFAWSWSLAIEEQFYLLWPWLLLPLLRRVPARLVVPLLLACVAVAWVVRHAAYVGGARYEAWLFGPQTHVDALLCGAVVAFVLHAGRDRVAGSPLTPLVGALGLTMLVVLDHIESDGLPLPARYDVTGFGQTAVAAACVVLCVAALPAGLLGRLLSVRPLPYLGRISYSLYLVNTGVFTAFTTLVHRNPIHSSWGWVTLPIVVLLAAASYHWVETPLRRRWSLAPVSDLAGSPASPSSRSAPAPSAAGCSTGSRRAPSAG